MKQWPEELSTVQPTGEYIGSSGNFRFVCRCVLTYEQRKVLRGFLFELKKDEEFRYTYQEIDREFVCKLESANLSERPLRSNVQKEYRLLLQIKARELRE